MAEYCLFGCLFKFCPVRNKNAEFLDNNFLVVCPRTWVKPWVNLLLSSTALIRWIIVVWVESTKVT